MRETTQYNVNWLLAILWLTGELSQSVHTCKNASLHSKQEWTKHVAVVVFETSKRFGAVLIELRLRTQVVLFTLSRKGGALRRLARGQLIKAT